MDRAGSGMHRRRTFALGIIFLLLVITILAVGRYRVNNSLPDIQNPGPELSSLEPDSGATGTPVMIRGSGFTADGNLIMFGQGYIRDVKSADGTSLSFTVPDGLDLCAPGMEMCPEGFSKVLAGTYTVKVSNSRGTSNGLPFTVSGQGAGCTMEARLCPDGSSVGRVPPDCKFAPCPGE